LNALFFIVSNGGVVLEERGPLAVGYQLGGRGSENAVGVSPLRLAVGGVRLLVGVGLPLS